MKAIRIIVDETEKDKIESFVKSININEGIAALPVTVGSEIFVAALNECGIAYAKTSAAKLFDKEIEIIVVK